MKIGVVSDTHGVFREDLPSVIGGVDHIIHAGDMGTVEVYHRLLEIAPVTAVWGNMDPERIRRLFREFISFPLQGVEIAVKHIPPSSPNWPEALARKVKTEFGGEIRLFIFGHTHHSLGVEAEGVELFNPGSAGPRRFNNNPSVGIIELDGENIKTEIIPLR